MPSDGHWDVVVKKHRDDLASVFDANTSTLDYDAFRASTQKILEKYKARKFTKLLTRLDKHFGFLHGWTRVMSQLVNSNPEIASLVWGAILGLLTLVQHAVSALGKTVELLERMQEHIPILERYSALYPSNDKLKLIQCDIYDAYMTVVVACARHWRRNPIVNFLSSLVPNTFEREFDKSDATLIRLCDSFEKEARVTGDETHTAAARAISSSLASGQLTVATLKRGSTVRMEQNDFFHGRDSLLDAIHQSISIRRPPRLRSCVLFGMGGSGKTQTALEYTYRYKSSYQFIFWVGAEEESKLERDFADIITVLPDVVAGVDDKYNVKRVKDWLSNVSASWLLVFDNVTDNDAISEYMPSGTDCSGSIIITTQSSKIAYRTPRSFKIETFNEDEGAKLLLKHLPKEQHDVQHAGRISYLLDGLPLALAQAAGYIQLSKVSLAEFIEIYEALELSSALWATKDNFGKSLETVFDIALQALEPDARDLLDVLAFLNPDTIPEDLIFRAHLHPSLAPFSITNRKRISELRANLAGRHLTQRNSLGDSSYALWIHRSLKQSLIQRLQADPNRMERCQLACQQAFYILREVTPRHSKTSAPSKLEDWPTYRKVLPHILSLLNVCQTLPQALHVPTDNPLDLASLLLDVGHFMYESHSMEDAIRIMQAAQRLCDGQLGEDSHENERLQILWVVASEELNHGIDKRKDGIAHMERILELRRRHAALVEQPSREVSLPLATACNNLACAYMHDYDYDRAEPLLLESVKILTQWGDEKKLPSGYGEHKKNMALVGAARKDFQKALGLADESVKLFALGSGSRMRPFLLARYLRACILFESGRVKDSLAEHLEVLRLRQETMGGTHDHALDSLYAVGNAYFAIRKLDDAERHLRLCLSNRVAYYETRIPRVLYLLSKILFDKGCNQEADQLIQDARAMRAKLLPREYESRYIGLPEAVVYERMANLWCGRV